jgi:hypothetical protein
MPLAGDGFGFMVPALTRPVALRAGGTDLRCGRAHAGRRFADRHRAERKRAFAPRHRGVYGPRYGYDSPYPTEPLRDDRPCVISTDTINP